MAARIHAGQGVQVKGTKPRTVSKQMHTAGVDAPLRLFFKIFVGNGKKPLIIGPVP